MKILWIWEVVIDKTYFVPEFMEDWQKTQSSDSITAIWWPVPAALKFLKNMWAEVTLIWSVWKDNNSIYAEEQFDKYWINTFLIYDKSTKVNTVIVNEKTASRTIIKDKIQNKLIDKIPFYFLEDVDAIIFDRSEPEAFNFVLKYKKSKTKIIVDPSSEFSPKIIHMMKNSDATVFPIETVKKMSELDNRHHNLKILFEKIWKTLIITDWWNGTHIFDWEKMQTIDALDIKPVDTNWAWDVFRWAFAWGLLNNWNLEKIVKFSNKVAWMQCLRKWNLTAVPDKEMLGL